MDSYFKHIKNIAKEPTLINIVDDYTFKWFCCLYKVHTRSEYLITSIYIFRSVKSFPT